MISDLDFLNYFVVIPKLFLNFFLIIPTFFKTQWDGSTKLASCTTPPRSKHSNGISQAPHYAETMRIGTVESTQGSHPMNMDSSSKPVQMRGRARVYLKTGGRASSPARDTTTTEAGTTKEARGGRTGRRRN